MSDHDVAPILQVRDLTVRFDVSRTLGRRRHHDVVAVDGVSFDVHAGSMVGLVGESGSGKTTLGRAVLQLLRPTSGSVLYKGADLTDLSGAALRDIRTDMQMVFQNPDSTLNPRMRVGRSVSEPLLASGFSRSDARARVAELLELVGVPADHADRYPHQFSGGQRQRLGVARALATRPSLVVCDEPIASLDVSIQGQVLNLLIELQEQTHATFVFISHDLGVVRRVCHDVLVMYRGRIVESGPARQVSRHPAHPYTRMLLEAAPSDPRAVGEAERFVASDAPPAPVATSHGGCRFRGRCQLYRDLGKPAECDTVRPHLRILPSGQSSACHFVQELHTESEPLPATPGELEADGAVPALNHKHGNRDT